MKLAYRVLFAILALPFLVAIIVPAAVVLLAKPAPPAGASLLGLIQAAAGAAILGSCIRSFAREGRGTLAPWDPPQKLVVHGLFRWVRNPMYIGVLLLLAGWAVCWRSVTLAIYACAVAAGFHLRVVFFEEPRLRREFGDEFIEYAKSVSRWVPRIPRGR